MSGWLVNSTQVPYCAVCGYQMNSVAKAVDSDPEVEVPELPKEGDLSVCVRCLSIGVFQSDGSLRAATSEECQSVPDWMREQIGKATNTSRPS
jgi:Zn ribbon nucleic-acid-binding protein